MKSGITFIFVAFILINFSYSQEKTYKITNLKMNDEKAHYGLVYYQNDQVFFTSYLLNTRNKIRLDNDQHPIFTLYEGKKTQDGEVNDIKRFKATEDVVFNSSSAAFSPDGKYMYITTNFVRKGKTYKHDYKSVNLHIERGEYIEGEGWTNFETLSFCSPDYSYGHPSVSLDGNYLYFVSNIPSAKGPTDVFRVKIIGNNEFGKIENLGDHINSPRRETFPFVSKDNVLYFSSDRVGGVGGLDIYQCKINGDNSISEPVLLSKPINSKQDDFCYVLNENGKEGYLTSNRSGGKGEDDIYYFVIE